MQLARLTPWPHTLRAALLCSALVSLSLPLSAAADKQPPTTFGTQIGHALLCQDQLNSNFFYSYLTTFFGPPYKHADGAYWFKTKEALLWGMPVSEVMVGDLSSAVEFIGAVVDTSPERLAEAVQGDAGILFQALSAQKYPIREARTGSRIIYANKKSKIYCAKSKLLLNPSNVPMQKLPQTPQLLDQR
jgi:hypothetical protein